MNYNEIRDIIKLFKEYDLSRIYIESKELKLEIENTKNQNYNLVNIEDKSEKTMCTQTAKIDEHMEYLIISPLVGTISISENKTTSKKYSVGDMVKKGDVLCYIEAMKMLNEIICKHDGIITEILTNDNELVEYEQPLIRIKKNGEYNV